MAIREISPSEVDAHVSAGAAFIDVREEHERVQGQAEGVQGIAKADLLAEPTRFLPDRDRDIVIICHQTTAEVGQTVVAYLRDENAATLKKYYPEANGKVRLQPANSTMEPIMTDADNLEIKGRVVSVLRHLA